MSKNNSKWPPYFPYPSSWLRTLSIIPFVPVGAFSSVFLMSLVLLFINDAIGDKQLGVLITLLILAALLVCAFIYALCHHTIIRKLKGMPTLLSQWKGIYAMITLNVALAPVWILAFLFNEEVYYRDEYYNTIRRVQMTDTATQIALLLFFVISASMFQFEFVNLNNWLKKRERRLKKKREREAIEQEMEGIKAEIDRKRKEKIAKCKRKSWTSKKKK
jgi:hypothetical protein